MKYIWEEKDIRHGKMVCKPMGEDKERFVPNGWTAKWTFQIGWIGSGDNSCLVCITDGMVGQTQSRQELADRC